MSRQRFCFLTTFYPPYNFGGDGVAVQRLARALVRRGHHVTVVHDVDAFETLVGRALSGPPRVRPTSSAVAILTYKIQGVRRRR